MITPRHLSLLFLLLLLSCKSGSEADLESDRSLDDNDKNEIENQFYPIKKFVDGDTFWIDDGTKKGIKIRFIGINCPESRPLFSKPAEPYGKEASNYVEDLIGEDGKVRLELDVDEFDRYGRTLAYIYLEDGTFLNEDLLEKGWAEVMTIPPNVKYVDVFLAAQKQARGKRLGIWADINN
jgi:micrococcal nuclease